MRVLAPAGRPTCSTQPPSDSSEELGPMEGISGSDFPSPSLLAYHSTAVKGKEEDCRESYVPQVVKLGSQEAGEIPSSREEKGRRAGGKE